MQPDEVPLYHQLNGYADLDAYKGRSDFSSLARYNTTAQQFYIGVWNVQEDIVAPGSFNLTAYATPADQNLCPFNCSGRGTCLANGTCRCSPGRPLTSPKKSSQPSCLMYLKGLPPGELQAPQAQ